MMHAKQADSTVDALLRLGQECYGERPDLVLRRKGSKFTLALLARGECKLSVGQDYSELPKDERQVFTQAIGKVLARQMIDDLAAAIQAKGGN